MFCSAVRSYLKLSSAFYPGVADMFNFFCASNFCNLDKLILSDMKILPILFFAIGLGLSITAQNIKPNTSIVVNDPLLNKVIPENVEIKNLAEGFEWTEGAFDVAAQPEIKTTIPTNKIKPNRFFIFMLCN